MANGSQAMSGVKPQTKKGELPGYEKVKARKKRFYAEHPDGRIVVDCIVGDIESAKFKASIYLNVQEQKHYCPRSTGFAQEFKGVGGFANKTSWLENCEESAVGRALDNAGYCGTDDGPSAEELEAAKRNKEALEKKIQAENQTASSSVTSPSTADIEALHVAEATLPFETDPEKQPEEMISGKQNRMIWACVNDLGASEEQLHKRIKDMFGLISLKDLTKLQASELIGYMDSKLAQKRIEKK